MEVEFTKGKDRDFDAWSHGGHDAAHLRGRWSFHVSTCHSK
jgi:hypothetical protein